MEQSGCTYANGNFNKGNFPYHNLIGGIEGTGHLILQCKLRPFLIRGHRRVIRGVAVVRRSHVFIRLLIMSKYEESTVTGRDLSWLSVTGIGISTRCLASLDSQINNISFSCLLPFWRFDTANATRRVRGFYAVDRGSSQLLLITTGALVLGWGYKVVFGMRSTSCPHRT